MASANLRYIALRSRLAALLEAEPGMLLDSVVRELYRALPHYTAIVFFRVEQGGLAAIAAHGLDVSQAANMGEGLAAVAVSGGQVVFAPDLTHDRRARPLHEEMRGELAVPALHGGHATLVLDVQSRRAGGLTFYDRELLVWLAERLVERALAP